MGEATYEFSENDDVVPRGKDYSTICDYIRMGFAEFGGVFVIVFLSCMGCTTGMSGGGISALQMSLTGGLSVMTAIHIFGHISGAHVNPAVTVSGMAMGVVDWKKALIYIVCQVLGAITGYAVLLFVTPSRHVASSSHCVTLPSGEITPIQAILVEVVVTFILCIAINAAWDGRNVDKIDSLSIRLGLIVAACAMAAGPYTGASMNPARSIGPAIWNKNGESLYVYILGPIIGGILSGYFYKYVLLKPKTPE